MRRPGRSGALMSGSRRMSTSAWRYSRGAHGVAGPGGALARPLSVCAHVAPHLPAGGSDAAGRGRALGLRARLQIDPASASRSHSPNAAGRKVRARQAGRRVRTSASSGAQVKRRRLDAPEEQPLGLPARRRAVEPERTRVAAGPPVSKLARDIYIDGRRSPSIAPLLGDAVIGRPRVARVERARRPSAARSRTVGLDRARSHQPPETSRARDLPAAAPCVASAGPPGRGCRVVPLSALHADRRSADLGG